MLSWGRRSRRAAVLSVVAALVAGACTGGSGDPESALGENGSGPGDSAPTAASYVEVAATTPTVSEDSQLAGLPLTTWAAAGARPTVSLAAGDRYDVTDFGAVADDGISDSQAINEAIEAARADGGGTVVIPAGTFSITESIELRSRILLRGEGRGTRLELDLNDQSGFGIRATGTATEAWTPLSADIPAGATSIDLPVAPNTDGVVSVMYEIEQDNTPEILTQPEWDVTWGDQSEGEVFVLETSADGTGRLSLPLISGYTTDRNARIRQLQPVEDASVEDLTIIRLDEGYGHTIALRYTFNTSVINVVSTRTSFAHVGVEQSLGCTIADNILHDATDFGDGGRAYGVSLARHTTGCLVVNNTLYDLRHALILQLGASGNVVAYNHARGSAGYEDRRPRADISLHGHWPQRNLFEGNIVDRIEIADWWGPAGPENTFLRNCVLDHVILLDSSEDQYFAGNRFGASEITIDPTVQVTTFLANEGDSVPDSGRDSSLPVSLWRNDAPQFLGGSWPPIEPSQDSPTCDLPASGRSPLGNR